MIPCGRARFEKKIWLKFWSDEWFDCDIYVKKFLWIEISLKININFFDSVALILHNNFIQYVRNILLYMLCGSAYTNREERTIYYIQTHNLTLSQCYRQHNKIVWLMLYSDSRVCYPCVIQLINKFKHTHTHNECTMILFLLKMRISHRPWLLVCLLIRLLVYLIFFPQLFIQSLLFWLTKIFFQTISNTHSQKEKKKKKKKRREREIEIVLV